MAGRKRLPARGTAEVLQALTAATLIHLAVFFPIFFMQKRIRLLYQDLFYTVSFSLLISLAVAVVLVPVMAARFPCPALTVNWLISAKTLAPATASQGFAALVVVDDFRPGAAGP